ncbi:FAD/NAD(P)-binding protein [Acetobacter nitrogenifigens]|uniref:Hydroxyacylglutathione hydrolase n=1 Tax=Acetobacter nitrogenifigens DSM 23921 = NBRC 105050 TaxID=1120919 RepID=A0A511XBA2_9PROT|nr:FAD-dependent oxidoreductase [Acetobacter nitrogenifigens]GEN60249.1 hydroxyacylglutathione hydrolase [Acetobacter nitrogenifigens DSM 23921 = NBRC 105050]
MTETDIRDIVVIGGGASGTLTAWNLAVRHGVTCTVIDPSERPGFGLAYSTPSLKNLLNVAARGMSADPDDPDHFLKWLRDNVPGSVAPGEFVPRAIYGLYLRNLYSIAGPEHERQAAVACRRLERGFEITLADGRKIRAGKVVLGCGHFDPARLPGIPPELDATGRYHHNAWAERVFAGIAVYDEVTVIGTGLTTVDVLLRLRENGHRGRVTALSRRGLFPERHADYTPLPAPVVTPCGVPPTARAYLRAFHAALKRGTNWRAAVDSMRSVTNVLWLALPDTEKIRFQRHLLRRWEVVRHRMAPHIADILDQERRAGSLRVLDGRVTAIAADNDHLTITAVAAGKALSLRAAHVINCTGPSLNYKRVAAPLLHDLFDKGEIVPGFGGAGLSCTPDGALIDRAGKIADDLFVVGPARQGVLLESIAIPEIRCQAKKVADIIVNAGAT